MSLLIEALIEVIGSDLIESIYNKTHNTNEKRWVRVCAALTLFLCIALVFGTVISLSIIVIINGEPMGYAIIGIMIIFGFLILKKISKDIKQKQNDKT